jgi:hypothetical protein
MHMIRHDNVPTDHPAVPRMGRTPFLHEDLGCFATRENRFSMTDARSDEINRKIDPNVLKPSQMFMHHVVVAEWG